MAYLTICSSLEEALNIYLDKCRANQESVVAVRCAAPQCPTELSIVCNSLSGHDWLGSDNAPRIWLVFGIKDRAAQRRFATIADFSDFTTVGNKAYLCCDVDVDRAARIYRDILKAVSGIDYELTYLVEDSTELYREIKQELIYG